MLDEVIMLDDRAGRQERRHSNEPADRTREFVRIPGAGPEGLSGLPCGDMNWFRRGLRDEFESL